jgi:hypothetical protein
MFAKDKVSQSMIDAVKKVMESEAIQESTSEKVQTSTGMKVYGHRYGNSKKARQDQTKSSVDDLKGPKDKEVKEELKGNQKKIDKNHNNKIDGQDFAILRGQKNEEVEHLEERDEGKPGLMFKKIAAKASKEYGSKEAGNRVAGAIRKKVLAKEEIEELSEEQLDEMLNEVLGKDATAGDWIHDFVHSDNPKFAGKSKAERKKMALGAYYGKQNEGKEWEESTPKNTDIADKKEKMARLNDTGKKGPLHNVGKGIKAFLKGKPEPMESVEVEGETLEENHQNDDAAITTDTLAGRMPGGKMNSFKSFKTRVKPLDKEGDDSEKTADCGCDAEETPARKSIMAKEEAEQVEEKVIAGVGGWEKSPGKNGVVTDKSGAKHTPMSRAKDLARLAFKKVQKDLGKK